MSRKPMELEIPTARHGIVSGCHAASAHSLRFTRQEGCHLRSAEGSWTNGERRDRELFSCCCLRFEFNSAMPSTLPFQSCAATSAWSMAGAVGKCLVFASTKRMCEELAQNLMAGGVSCAAIHGDKDGSSGWAIKRLRAAQAFAVARHGRINGSATKP